MAESFSVALEPPGVVDAPLGPGDGDLVGVLNTEGKSFRDDMEYTRYYKLFTLFFEKQNLILKDGALSESYYINQIVSALISHTSQ